MFSSALFILWLLLPLIGCIIRNRIPLFRNHFVWFFLATVLVGSMLYVGAASILDAELECQMYQFDLDGDRSFSGAELTHEAEEAMRRYSTDTGRTLAPFVAAPATAVWTGVWFLLLNAMSWLYRKLFRRKAVPKPPLDNA